MYINFLCEFWNTTDTLADIITKEKKFSTALTACMVTLLTTSCSMTEQVCLIGMELLQSTVASSAWHWNFYQMLSWLLLEYLASLLLTHQVQKDIRHTKNSFNILSPRNMGWLWAASGGDQVRTTVSTWWFSSAYFSVSSLWHPALYPNPPSSHDFVTSSQNFY